MNDNDYSTHVKYLCPHSDDNISIVCGYNKTKISDHMDKYIEYDILNFHVQELMTKL